MNHSPACSRLLHELRQAPFDILEPDNKTIDVKRSFAPSPTISMIVAKVMFFVWTLATILINNFFYIDHSRHFSLAYLTHWALVSTLFYQTFSILVMATLSKSEAGVSKSLENNGDPVPWLVRSLWCLFSIAATVEVDVALIYWPWIIFGGTMPVHRAIRGAGHQYINVMMHGGVAALVLIDGLCLNRTPLRVRQVIFPVLFGLAYVLWTVIHWQQGIGNPEEEYDGIYEFVDWKNDTRFTLMVVVLEVLVIIHVVFLGIRLLSLWSGWFKFDGSWRRIKNNGSENVPEDTTHTKIDEECGEPVDYYSCGVRNDSDFADFLTFIKASSLAAPPASAPTNCPPTLVAKQVTIKSTKVVDGSYTEDDSNYGDFLKVLKGERPNNGTGILAL